MSKCSDEEEGQMCRICWQSEDKPSVIDPDILDPSLSAVFSSSSSVSEEPSLLGSLPSFSLTSKSQKINNNNPLISPCMCRGSSRYVHRLCLRTWRLSQGINTAHFLCCPACGCEYATTCTWLMQSRSALQACLGTSVSLLLTFGILSVSYAIVQTEIVRVGLVAAGFDPSIPLIKLVSAMFICALFDTLFIRPNPIYMCSLVTLAYLYVCMSDMTFLGSLLGTASMFGTGKCVIDLADEVGLWCRDKIVDMVEVVDHPQRIESEAQFNKVKENRRKVRK